MRVVDGKLVEIYLNGRGHEITPKQLRELPLLRMRSATMVRPEIQAVMAAETAKHPDLDVAGEVDRAYGVGADTAKWFRDKAVKLKPPSDGLTPQFLQDVAAAYTSAVARGERPNVALAEQTGFAPRTVQRWVYLARKAGHLAPTRPGETG
ncbi:hypothetical protein E1218_13040 [Kribbella turkmenica]|uniref:Uncharacterized protein n=1 Tax=Kribbella turkmenica TaxID=2530375 RepID=A0A4R4X814_9ACTN|nr:hypothetical protein [Kribbella turkmenica]TDD26535.1 hypothetical protein E1218_13040 [Kribbella turkmenica]